MPTYEYRCKSCGEHLEVVQSFKDDPLTECPACGGVLRKVFGSIGITFKGSGFYKTDSRAASGKAKVGSRSDNAGDSSSDSKSSDGTKGDSAKSSEGKSESAKSESAKSDSAKSDGKKSESSGSRSGSGSGSETKSA